MQLPGQLTVAEQSDPDQPKSQEQVLFAHEPRPVQFPGQPKAEGSRKEQSFPVYMRSQMHVPLKHAPFPEQCFGHDDMLQSTPEKPSWQVHIPPKQVPWSVQLPGHSSLEQSADDQPGSHAHLPEIMSQDPCCEQLFMQSTREQSGPVYQREH